MNQSATPRTEEALIDNADLSDEGWGKSELVHAAFARQLETELAQAKAELDGIARTIEDSNYYGHVTDHGSVGLLTQVAVAARVALEKLGGAK